MAKLDLNKLPKHIGIIIDGNGRWAIKRGLPRFVGHDVGFDTLIKILKYAFELGIDTISVFCFSTENWNRPKVEVEHLMQLFRKAFTKDFEELYKYDAKLYVSGDYSKFPEDIAKKIEESLEKTKNFKSHKLNLCLNYGSHDEIIRAVNNIIKDDLRQVDATIFNNYLYSKDLPPLDFIIRSSGECRLSNFMLWQAAYSEFYFEKTPWPAYTKRKLNKALLSYQNRERRFGAIKDKK